MRADKFTPGPWEVRVPDRSTTPRVYAKSGLIATPGHRRDTAEEIANVLLIAEAPVLLESLRVMLDWLDDGNRQLSDACTADVAYAREAIVRATGEAA